MTNPNLLFIVVRERARAIEVSAARRGPLLADLHAGRRPQTGEPVTVRLAVAADGPQLQRLAELDSACVPAQPLLIGERAGRAVAALSLAGGEVVADPFTPTADVVALLRLRARQLRGGSPRGAVRHRLAAARRPLRAGGG
jgi:hypothetical protein